jgi:glycosyltransferase involved in cell wall biosynthesis
MKIVLFTHPNFLNSASMPRFALMITKGMQSRGHIVEVWSPSPIMFLLPIWTKKRKWLGYIDQFIIFPILVRLRMLSEPNTTLFVFADQALGPWVPLVERRPHVVHTHDFMALRSALGEIPQNPTGWTGRQYQAMIRRGFSKAKCFISVSENTKRELARFLEGRRNRSEVVFNGLNFPFFPMAAEEAAAALQEAGLDMQTSRFLLHVGGNQWYKNRVGVLEIYAAYAQSVQSPLPLLMIGDAPSEKMRALAVKGGGIVKFASGLPNETVRAAYSLAELLIFPSLAEGFGWPVAEAMACGCPVLTTDEAPMTEVGGAVAHYLPKRPIGNCDEWAKDGATKVTEILNLAPAVASARVSAGLEHVKQFDTDTALDRYEAIYQQVLAEVHR